MHNIDFEGIEFILYQLNDLEYQWYEEYNQSMGDDVEQVIQEEFFSDFINHFFPCELREDKAEEVIIIRYGRMSVKEYALKFHQLYFYDPKLVSSIRDRVRKFALVLS